MAPVVQALARTPGINSLVCVTAQHRQMLDQVLESVRHPPGCRPRPDAPQPEPGRADRRDLHPPRPGPAADLQPDWMLVQGDTTTVMAAALLAFYNHIRVGHVEAGLRTDDKWQPFPEEINRRVAGVVADLHFAPTEMVARRTCCAKTSPPSGSSSPATRSSTRCTRSPACHPPPKSLISSSHRLPPLPRRTHQAGGPLPCRGWGR